MANALLKSKILDLIEKETGYKLNESDRTSVFLKTRLGPLMGALKKDYSIQSFDDLVPLFKSEPSIRENILASVTTHTTEFFRENDHFKFLDKNIENWLGEKAKIGDFDLRIWCAATSTGQEIYSLLLTLNRIKTKNSALFSQFDLKVLCTDIDVQSLQTASKGVYSEELTRKIPDLELKKHFEMRTSIVQVGKSEIQRKYYRIKKNFRENIRFATHNLIHTPYPFQKGFDIIFCRNVLIYFAPEKAAEVTQELTRHLKINGYLFLGHSETAAAQDIQNVKQVSIAVYQKQGGEKK